MRIVIVYLPAVPGPNTRHVGANAERSAAREIRNATKAGLGEGAYMRGLLLTG